MSTKEKTEIVAAEHYKDCQIVNIRRGTGSHSNTIYANLVDKDGKRMISASLDYISHVLVARL